MLGPSCLSTFAIILGGNPDLEPEQATNWSFGADFEPIHTLRLGATYYNIEYSDRIGGPSFGTIGLLAHAGYPTYAGNDFMAHPLNNTNVIGPEKAAPI